MKVIVTGGRDFAVEGLVYKTLTNLGCTMLIEGGARGADRIARNWALDKAVPYKTYEADWDTHGKPAGHIRNREMLVENRDAVVVAFPGGKGTRNCVEQARKLGFQIIEVDW